MLDCLNFAIKKKNIMQTFARTMKFSETELNSIWYRFSLKQSPKLKNDLIMQYLWLVKYVQKQMNLPKDSVLSNEDFTSIGILGLSEAIDRFELSRGIKFESYAIPRIRGIIQDELRKLDWLSRTARKKAQDFLNANDELRNEVGREATQQEIMSKLNVTPEQYEKYLAAAAAAKASFSMSDSHYITIDNEDIDILDNIDNQEENSLDKIVNVEKMDFLTKYLKELNEKKRLVMSLYYFEELTFKEIGTLLNVSESRVCQIHTQVLSELKKKLAVVGFN